MSVKNIVLVHGGFVDGSGWEPVYKILKKDGYSVRIVQNPTLSLADDVAVTRRAIAAEDGPVILVGHSYGGVVVSEAGTDPKVKASRLHRGLRAGQGRVSVVADRQSSSGRPRAADSPASGWIPVP